VTTLNIEVQPDLILKQKNYTNAPSGYFFIYTTYICDMTGYNYTCCSNHTSVFLPGLL